MPSNDRREFFTALDRRCKWIKNYILHPRFVGRFSPAEIQWAVTAYVRYGGKRLRPAILLFSCGAVGGDERQAIPAAAAVEIFHTWTLVHDDIIDRDPMRRGQATVHQRFFDHYDMKPADCSLPVDEARHYGVSLAILTGDIQHGWGISMMTELATRRGVTSDITLKLIDDLDTYVLNTLVEGEVLDIQYSHQPLEALTPEDIETMLWKKTGALYQFCGRAGAMIGLGKRKHPYIEAVSEFAALCGTAFQLQDDILGVVGNQEVIGKPVGSDLREGKKTLVVHYAYQNASLSEKKLISGVLGNPKADESQIRRVIQALRDLGGIKIVNQRAKDLIAKAQNYLQALPENQYRAWLKQWADYMVQREF
ncbi:MAG: polyprenyl synthetase family protein [Calditrichaeota bacterium]|nr:polyprenyl synthetase family protein [Calditrichota bacterium]